MSTSVLFSPIEVKGVRFKNRVVMPPMVTLKADAEGRVTDTIVEHYAQRARASTGLIIVEATAVESGAVWKGGLAAFADKHAPGLAGLAERIHCLFQITVGFLQSSFTVHHSCTGFLAQLLN